VDDPMMAVAPLPTDAALLKRVDGLTRKAVRLAARSASARPYESYEYHLVHWKLPWHEALAAMRRVSPRVAMVVDTVVVDDSAVDGGRPLGHPLAALPLDVVTCEEALALQDDGFRLEIAVRFWPGITGTAPDDAVGRLECATRRARKKAHTYYRTTGDAFIYARSFPRSLRVTNP
jgi:hypothetical protein